MSGHAPQQSSSSYVNLPRALTTYTPTTVDTPTKIKIDRALNESGHMQTIRSTLSEELAREGAFKMALEDRAKQLLKSGACLTAEDCLSRIIHEVMTATASSVEPRSKQALPLAIQQKALEITEKCLKEVVQIDD